MADRIYKRELADGSIRWDVTAAMKDPITGRRKQYRKTFTTQKAAKSWLAEQKVAVDSGTVVVRDPRTVSELMAFWLAVHKLQVSATTLSGYEVTSRVHICPTLGAIQVQQLTTAHIQRFFNKKVDEGCGVRTLQLCKLNLSQALDLAVTNGWVTKNVADAVRAPRWKAEEFDVWSPEQAQRFLTLAESSGYGPLWVLCLTKGLRRGEVLGLRWSEVDLDKGVLHIRHTIGLLNGHIEVKPPKSAKSRRTLELKAGIVAMLRAHKTRQAEKRLKLGPRWRDENLVFCNALGSAINPNNLVREFDRLVEKAGVPSIRIHDLRHTYATLALAAGENPKVVSESLGHSDVGITLRVYSHVLPSQRHNLADRMERLFLGATPEQADLTG